ncbi:hypothetical protein EC3003_2834 [Escherichia coli 3003]|nr:hypothetical protein EC3003_2834 [Escherichia coli 3003]
MNHERT